MILVAIPKFVPSFKYITVINFFFFQKFPADFSLIFTTVNLREILLIANQQLWSFVRDGGMFRKQR